MPRRVLNYMAVLAIFFAPWLNAQVSAKSPQAANETQQAAPVRDVGSDDPLGRATPRGTVFGFIRAANREDYDLAVRYLDTRQHGELARELARQLQAILDREASIDLNKVSRRPEGDQANLESADRYLVGVVNTSADKLEIRLDRVQRADEPPVWLFSETTLQRVPDFYADMGETPVIEGRLPDWLKGTILSVPLWRWIAFLIAIPLILLFGSFLVRLLQALLTIVEKRIWGEANVTRSKGLAAALRLILFGILAIVYGNYSDTLLHRTFWRNLGNVLIVFGITWLFVQIVGLLTEFTVARLKRIESFDKIALAGLIGRLSQIAALTIGILIVLHLAGVNLTAALTGLGIGGLAVAFAAQKTLENLFGGIMIISDRPVRVGDLCRVGTTVGHVVDIGLRSTQIRTLDRSIMTIPNGQLAAINIENLTLRDKYWFHPILALSQQTTRGQMTALLVGIRDTLNNHAKVESATLRVRFIGIGSSSFDVEIFAYVFAADLSEFYALQEELLLVVMAVVESVGASLAVPTQITQLVGPAIPPQVPPPA